MELSQSHSRIPGPVLADIFFRVQNINHPLCSLTLNLTLRGNTYKGYSILRIFQILSGLNWWGQIDSLIQEDSFFFFFFFLRIGFKMIDSQVKATCMNFNQLHFSDESRNIYDRGRFSLSQSHGYESDSYHN